MSKYKKMKSKRSLLIPVIISIAAIFTMQGCLNNTSNSYDSTVQTALQVQKFDSTIVAGQDSIIVNNVRFIFGDGAVVIDGDTTHIAEASNSWSVFSISPNSGGAISILQGLPAGTYGSIVYSFRKAPDGFTQDTEFIGTQHYSMIIDGQYNGSNFTFKLARNFKIPFQLNPATVVPQENQQVLFLVTTNPRQWFSNSSGGFYDPSVSDNQQAIGDGIQQSFSIENPRVFQ